MSARLWKLAKLAADGAVWVVAAPAFPFIVLAGVFIDLGAWCERKRLANIWRRMRPCGPHNRRPRPWKP